MDRGRLAIAVLLSTGSACALVTAPRPHAVTAARRLAILRRAQVWAPTDVASMDLRAGPQGGFAFAPEARVECEYVRESMGGHSPKFSCVIGGDDRVKVKYGRDNGEVYGEVAATRLLWALGFPADRMYPVQVSCRRCPASLGGRTLGDDTMDFEVAAIERKFPGRDIELANRDGWTWPELDLIDPQEGGAPAAQRDGLKLLAAVLQHSDSKSGQQRLLCSDKDDDNCPHAWAMLNDLGLTFGRTSEMNLNMPSSVNFERWSKTPVWDSGRRCVANITVSYTGTLDHPAISEEGRAFLAGLLTQLSDRQLHDLFEVARFPQRRTGSAAATSDQWVAAFKSKRDEIVSRRCDN